MSEFLQGRRPAATLARLATGSWIHGDLTTWIGDPEHNRAWDALRRTREYLQERTNTSATEVTESAVGLTERTERFLPPHESPPSSIGEPLRPVRSLWHSGLQQAWHALHAAEGSDWFWWYSHRNSSDQDALFDRLFRHALASVYTELGDEPPEWLAEPICRAVLAADHRPARGYVTPQLEASAFPGEAWASAASLRPAGASTGAMQRASGLIERCFVGHDPTRLYVRLDVRQPFDHFDTLIYLGGPAGAAANQRVDATFPDPDLVPRDLAAAWLVRRDAGQSVPFLYEAESRGSWRATGPVTAAIGEKTIELELLIGSLGLQLGDELKLFVALVTGRQVVASLPERRVAIIPLQAF